MRPLFKLLIDKNQRYLGQDFFILNIYVYKFSLFLTSSTHVHHVSCPVKQHTYKVEQNTKVKTFKAVMNQDPQHPPAAISDNPLEGTEGLWL